MDRHLEVRYYKTHRWNANIAGGKKCLKEILVFRIVFCQQSPESVLQTLEFSVVVGLLQECYSKFGNFINMYLEHRPFHLLCEAGSMAK